MTDWESKCLSGMCNSLDAFICFLFCLNDSFFETGSSYYYSWVWTWTPNPPTSTPANAQLIFVVFLVGKGSCCIVQAVLELSAISLTLILVAEITDDQDYYA